MIEIYSDGGHSRNSSGCLGLTPSLNRRLGFGLRLRPNPSLLLRTLDPLLPLGVIFGASVFPKNLDLTWRVKKFLNKIGFK